MDTRVTHTDPTLADNEKTIEFLIGRAGGDQKEIAKIREWGEKRQARIEKLCGFAGFLERDGILDINDRSMSRIALAFAFQHCIAIASRHGFDMGTLDSLFSMLALPITLAVFYTARRLYLGHGATGSPSFERGTRGRKHVTDTIELCQTPVSTIM